MNLPAPTTGTIQRIDERVRIVVALLLAVALAPLTDLRALGMALFVGILLLPSAGFAAGWMTRRFITVNMITLVCFAVLPFSMPGETVRGCGLPVSKDGLMYAARIGLKLNAVVAICTTMLSSIEPAHLGTALRRLGVPSKLTELLFLTVRYTDLLREEYGRMRDSMKTRGYSPRINMHSLRSTGYLIGGLLTRSFVRSERLLAAMHCRGYRGQFPSLRQPRTLAVGDWCAAGAALVVLAAVTYLELEWRQIL